MLYTSTNLMKKSIYTHRKIIRLLSIVLSLIILTTVVQFIAACTDPNNVSTESDQTFSKEKQPQKISSSLLNVIETVEPTSDKEGLSANKTAHIDKEGNIQVYIELYELDETKLETLKEQGLRIDIYDPDEKLVQGWANPAQIRAISGLTFVKFIDLPDYGVTN